MAQTDLKFLKITHCKKNVHNIRLVDKVCNIKTLISCLYSYFWSLFFFFLLCYMTNWILIQCNCNHRFYSNIVGHVMLPLCLEVRCYELFSDVNSISAGFPSSHLCPARWVSRVCWGRFHLQFPLLHPPRLLHRLEPKQTQPYSKPRPQKQLLLQSLTMRWQTPP